MKYTFTLFTGILTVSIVIAQTPRKVAADKIVAIVGDKIILQSDIQNEILDRRRHGETVPDNFNCAIMEQALTLKALALQAERDSIEISNDEVEAELDNRIRANIRSFGSEQALIDIAGRSIYQLKEDFRPRIRERLLVNRLSLSVVANVNITPQEVMKYFSSKNADSLPYYESTVEMGEIVLYPTPNSELEDLVKFELNDFKQQIAGGRQKFDILARLYSEDKDTKDLGGELKINRTQKGGLPSYVDPSFIGQVFRLKSGQISPVFRSKAGYHIVQLVERNGDDATIRHILRMPKITHEEITRGINKLDSVRSRIIAGVITFNEAVARYTEAETKSTAGMRLYFDGSTNLPIAELDKDLVVLLDQTKLQPGHYSKPAAFTDETGKQGVRLIFFKSRTKPHRQNLKDDYDRIAEEALAIKKEQAMDAWLSAKIPSYYLMIDPKYNNCSMLNKWIQKSATANR